MSDQSNKAGAKNITTTGSDNQAAGAGSKSAPQDHAETHRETQMADSMTTLSISVPNATARLIRIVAAASDSTVGKTVAALLAGAVEREMPSIIRGLQAK